MTEIQGKSTLVRVTQRGFELSGVNCIHFGMLPYFHVSFAHCSLYLFRSPFDFLPSVIVYFSYLISRRITQNRQLHRIGPAYLLLFIFRVYKRSRLLIEGFYFCGVNRSFHSLLLFLSSWVNERPACVLNFFCFRGLTEGPAC